MYCSSGQFGELSNESVGKVVGKFVWKIPNFFSLPKTVNRFVQSPSFKFATAKWRLEIYLNGRTLYGSQEYVDVILKRIGALTFNQEVIWEFHFVNRLGNELWSFSSAHNFTIIQNTGEKTRYLLQARLEAEKSEIAPNGTVTVMCRIRTQKIPEYGTYSQTGLSETCGNVKETKKLKDKNNGCSEPSTQAEVSQVDSKFSCWECRKCQIWNPRNVETKDSENCWVCNALRPNTDKISDLEETKKLKDKHNGCSEASTQTEVDQGFRETDKLQDKIRGYSEASTQTEVDQGNDSVTQLRTPVHVKNLLQDFQELFSSEEDSDVTILVKGRKFRAHRAILKARSSVFAAMLRHNMQEKATGVVDIVDCDPDSFSDLLYYLYCGSLDKLSENNVFSVYVTADKYDVQDLKSECLAFMKKHLSVDTFCDTITLSLEHCESDLLQLATDFFIRNMAKVIVTVKWQTFMIANPVQCNELLMKAIVRTE